jgi:Kelch motif
MAGPWKGLNNTPSFSVDTMLLLTDGSVMCHEVETPNWHKLVPDANGDYVNGTWQAMTPLPANAPLSQKGPVDEPLYYASAVLKDGRVFVAGGEYNDGGVPVDLLTAEVYDPVADSWASVATPPGWNNIGDAPSCVLPDGKVLLGDINSTRTATFDPVAKTWATGGNKDDNSSEESWTLLPDHTILCAEVDNHPKAEKYVIATNKWVSAGSVPAAADLVLNVPGVSIEIGPAILMPDDRVFCVGASGHTALYNVKTGAWFAGPDFPTDSGGNLLRAFDAPAALLPNGHVLCVVGAVVTSGVNAGWAGLPISFFEFDGTALNPVPAPANAPNTLTYNCRLLLLPTGQVLYSNCSSDLEIYTPSGAPHAHWRPHITHVPKVLRHGQSYRLRGRQLNGLSQANGYGDDAQMATNYPLVRLKRAGSKAVYFCRTFDHSTMAVATGKKVHHTHFHVSHAVPVGKYDLVVIANGTHSQPIKVHVKP